MRIAAIDPGQKGAIGFVDTSNNDVFSLSLPYNKGYQSKPELWSTEFLNILEFYMEPDVIVIEQVNAMPGQGVSSSFKFGQNFGEVLALIRFYIEYNNKDVRFERIRPAEWKRKLGLTKKPKSASKDYVVTKFPSLKKIKVDEADAICLALYYQEKYLTK